METEEDGKPVDESKSEEKEAGLQILKYLVKVDKLRIEEQADANKVLSFSESKRRYKVKDSLGQTVYDAVEDLRCNVSSSGGDRQGFGTRILDAQSTEVMRIFRHLVSDADSHQRLEVFAPPEQLIGIVEHEQNLVTPKFLIMNSKGKTVARIKVPMSTTNLFGSVKFQVKSDSGRTVGAIKKQWSGLWKEVLTDADHYGLTFSPKLSVKDFVYFSNRAN
ncbi:unnamed protein product [Darwinula stevensoni]|uniref:Phospholipid scramblase n=1 Tax=Darwinula stevensoni TaxID=69355 RepID=A0A7R9AEQ3_9CRUS|nr:unnamed protein product [Darwinula stevensoni]CAG0902264.1 unnamed protein product [Darwinula stevensoni]